MNDNIIKSKSPTKPGFYWAKWKIGEDGSETFGGPSNKWEVVEVLDLFADQLEVNVPGESKIQKLENFYWGAGPLPPPD